AEAIAGPLLRATELGAEYLVRETWQGGLADCPFRLGHQPVEPLEVKVTEYCRRASHATGKDIERPADTLADANVRKLGKERFHPQLLSRTAERDEENVRLRFVDPLDQAGHLLL